MMSAKLDEVTIKLSTGLVITFYLQKEKVLVYKPSCEDFSIWLTEEYFENLLMSTLGKRG